MDNRKNTQSIKPEGFTGIQDRELTYEETHLPVTKEIIFSLLKNPNVTYLDLESLYWSVANSPDYTLYKYLTDISEKQETLIYKR